MKRLLIAMAAISVAATLNAQVGALRIPQQTGSAQSAQRTRVITPLTDQYLGFDLTKKLVNRGASYLLYSVGAGVSTGANTTETDGATKAIAANTIGANGKTIRARFWGTTAANANNKTVQIYFAGSSVYTTGAVAANNKPWFMEATIIRTGASAETVLIEGNFNATAFASVTTSTGNTTTALTIKNTMTNGSATASDITTSGATVEVLN